MLLIPKCLGFFDGIFLFKKYFLKELIGRFIVDQNYNKELTISDFSVKDSNETPSKSKTERAFGKKTNLKEN